MLRHWFHLMANAHVQGASQSGKSKFTEHCVRGHIVHGNGVCVFDWHGTLYRALLDFCTYRRVRRPIVLLDFSQQTNVVPFNPFALPKGKDPSVHVNAMASLLVKPWGAQNTNELPNYERIVKMMLAFMAATGEPLHHAAKLLHFPKKELREYAIAAIADDWMKQQWTELQYVKTLKEWRSEVLSTQNRLGRFLSSRAIVRTLGLLKKSISIPDLIRQKAIVLVNLKPSGLLDRESGKVLAALLLSEFLDAATENMGDPTPYFLYLDECQNYLTHDAAVILDETLKSGLRVSLIHHHMGQIVDPHLAHSIETNARLKVVFGGLPLEETKTLAEDFFLDESNERWLKEERYRTVTEYKEEDYFTYSDTEGDAEHHGENPSTTDSSGHSMSYGTRYVPHQRLERDGQEDYTREQVIAKLAARFSLPAGKCYVKTPRSTFLYTVPWVSKHLMNPARALEYEQSLLNPFPTIHEADKALEEAEARFLRRGQDYEAKGKSRPTKKRALSPQQ